MAFYLIMIQKVVRFLFAMVVKYSQVIHASALKVNILMDQFVKTVLMAVCNVRQIFNAIFVFKDIF